MTKQKTDSGDIKASLKTSPREILSSIYSTHFLKIQSSIHNLLGLTWEYRRPGIAEDIEENIKGIKAIIHDAQKTIFNNHPDQNDTLFMFISPQNVIKCEKTLFPASCCLSTFSLDNYDKKPGFDFSKHFTIILDNIDKITCFVKGDIRDKNCDIVEIANMCFFRTLFLNETIMGFNDEILFVSNEKTTEKRIMALQESDSNYQLYSRVSYINPETPLENLSTKALELKMLIEEDEAELAREKPYMKDAIELNIKLSEINELRLRDRFTGIFGQIMSILIKHIPKVFHTELFYIYFAPDNINSWKKLPENIDVYPVHLINDNLKIGLYAFCEEMYLGLEDTIKHSEETQDIVPFVTDYQNKNDSIIIPAKGSNAGPIYSVIHLYKPSGEFNQEDLEKAKYIFSVLSWKFNSAFLDFSKNHVIINGKY